MEFGLRYLIISIVLIGGMSSVKAKELNTSIVDGLGRPVSNVQVNIYWLKTITDDDVREISLARLRSDKNGQIKGSYDEFAAPHDEHIFYGVSKKGYEEYSSSNYKSQYVVKRKYNPFNLKTIIKLSGEKQIIHLRELLAGDYPDSLQNEPLEELVFSEEKKLRPALRSLINDPHVGLAVINLLSLIGAPEDLRLIVNNAPQPNDGVLGSRWAYHVVTALIEPSSDQEWAFLRESVLNKYKDRWVESGAIQTLMLIGAPVSRQILVEAALNNKNRTKDIQQAINYIDSKPESIADVNLIKAGEKIGNTLYAGRWSKNSKPRFNKNKDKALIDCEFILGRDRINYTATFHKIAGVWQLHGVRETWQALMAYEKSE
ncbi:MULTISPECIES: hypothetical protein [Methylomonas]|uniref:hypothetical protein n=1 Tax=Methylomonas TaxID=416 RepID=UPI000A879D47|nr:hypothetical protein [Methylomonas koyamae]